MATSPAHGPTVAVTGATGALGGLVARDLADRGIEQRLLLRRPAAAPSLPGATVFTNDYADPSPAALAGVDVLLMVSGSESADRLDQHRRFVEAASDAGVGHLVYTSFVGASPTCTFTLGRDHAATEEMIRASGMGWTFLRDSFYLDFLAHLPDEEGVIRGPAGDGRVAAVARADIARCAVAVLTDVADRGATTHQGATYDLTGPQALSFEEVARTVAEATGRATTYHDETVEEAYESRRRWPAPQWQYDAWVSTYTAIAAGELAAVTDDVERLTGRAPLSLRDLLRGH